MIFLVDALLVSSFINHMNNSSSMTSRYSTILLLSVMTLVGFGCSSPQVSLTDSTVQDGTIRLNDNAVTYEDKETGTQVQVGEQVTIPSNFPADVPIYDGDIAIIASSVSQQGEGSLMFNTNTGVQEVSDWYQSVLKKDGWSQETNMNFNNKFFQTYKKNQVVISLGISTEGDVTQVTLVRASQ